MRNLEINHTPLHPDGKLPVTKVVRHPHEWELADYEWSEETGRGEFTYTRTVGNLNGEIVQASVGGADVFEDVHVTLREQPTGRRHAGWRWHNGRYTR